MKYIFTLLLLAAVVQAQAQMGLIYGARAATAAASLASRQKKKQATAAALDKNASATPALGRGVTALSYRGQTIPCKRTDTATFKGAGGAEIQALETLLEERRTALLADSTSSFLSVSHAEAIVAAEHKAVAVRREWNYAPYRKELSLYQQEETRRQKSAPVPAK